MYKINDISVKVLNKLFCSDKEGIIEVTGLTYRVTSSHPVSAYFTGTSWPDTRTTRLRKRKMNHIPLPPVPFCNCSKVLP